MYKILVIEDEFHIRQIIKDYFSLKGIEVVEATQGYEALNIINETIDLILLDIMMPGIDGYEVCKQLRLKNKKTCYLYECFITRRKSVTGISTRSG